MNNIKEVINLWKISRKNEENKNFFIKSEPNKNHE